MSEARYRELLATSQVPPGLHDGLVLYLAHGLRPGSFLVCVLANDLRGACRRADDVCRARLFDIVAFLDRHAPIAAWGAYPTVEAWMNGHRLQRERDREAVR